MSESRLVDETYDSVDELAAAISATSRFGLVDITVTTTETPKFEHLPRRLTYHLDAVKPGVPSRSLQSTRGAS
jgi:hypothetical protein